MKIRITYPHNLKPGKKSKDFQGFQTVIQFQVSGELFFFVLTFTPHLNVKHLQSPGNLNIYITWKNKKWIKNLI